MSSRAGALGDAIRDAIFRGDFPAGSPLRQDQLASKLGVSKIPVREALQRLAAEGFVTFDANRGFSVTSLTAEDAEEIYQLRSALEPLLLERAMPDITIVDLAKAELALSRDDGAIPESNWNFHKALYSSAGWDRGLSMVRALHASVAPYLLAYIDDAKSAEASAEQHRALLEHCRAGDGTAAVAVLREHLAMARTSLTSSLARGGLGRAPVTV